MAPIHLLLQPDKTLVAAGTEYDATKRGFEPNLKFGLISFMLVESSFLG